MLLSSEKLTKAIKKIIARRPLLCRFVHLSSNASPGDDFDNLKAPASKKSLLAYSSDNHEVPLPDKHRFPMAKYALTRQALQADASLQGLLEIREVCMWYAGEFLLSFHLVNSAAYVERQILCTQAPLATEDELTRAHDAGYVGRFFRGELNDKELRSIGFPWSEGLVMRSRSSAGGTLAATRALLEWHLPITANIAGAARIPHLLPLYMLSSCAVEASILNSSVQVARIMRSATGERGSVYSTTLQLPLWLQ